MKNSKIDKIIFDVLQDQQINAGVKELNNCSETDMEIFLRQAEREGISGQIYSNCKKSGFLDKLEVQVKGPLEKEYLTNYGRNTIIRQELKEISRRLNALKTNILLIRGGSLLHKAYTDLGARPMIDLDFVVKEASFPKVKECLEDLGFRSYADYPFFFQKEGIYVDIHLDAANFWRVESLQNQLSLNNEKLWTRALPFNNLLYVRILDRYDSILCASDHMLWHSFERLIWFMDIAHIVRSDQNKFDWDVLFSRAEEMDMSKTLYFSLRFMRHYGLLAVPEHAVDYGYQIKLNWFDKRAIGHLCKNNRSAISGEILAFLSISSMWQRLTALREIIFIKKRKMPNATSERNILTYTGRIYKIFTYLIKKLFLSVKP